MLSLVASTLAFQAPVLQAPRPAVARSSAVTATVFDDGMATFKADYPWLAKYGFGPTVKAERWNGRHAMFGWLAIIATGYAKAHGWFPTPDVALKYEDWGALAQMGFGQYISNERAIIMIAHIHALGVSMAAAFGPQVLGDSLTLLEGEARRAEFQPALMLPLHHCIALPLAAPPLRRRRCVAAAVSLSMRRCR